MGSVSLLNQRLGDFVRSLVEHRKINTTKQPAQQTAQQTAVPAPVITDSNQGNMQTGNGSTTIRKRRGKSALIITNVNSNTGSSTGGGLNV